jgi:flagellar biogenesis protein FliO
MFIFPTIPLISLTPVLDAAAEAQRKARLRAVLIAALAFVVFLIVKKRRA